MNKYDFEYKYGWIITTALIFFAIVGFLGLCLYAFLGWRFTAPY